MAGTHTIEVSRRLTEIEIETREFANAPAKGCCGGGGGGGIRSRDEEKGIRWPIESRQKADR